MLLERDLRCLQDRQFFNKDLRMDVPKFFIQGVICSIAGHKYNYNTKLNGNSEYRFGYTRGKSFCFNYIVGGVSSFDRMLFPHKDPIVAQDYNTTVDGMFGGVDSPIPAADNGGLNGLFDMWAGSGSTSALGANPLWAGGSSGQFFGQ